MSHPRGMGWHYAGLTSWIQKGALLGLFWQPGASVRYADTWLKALALGKVGDVIHTMIYSVMKITQHP